MTAVTESTKRKLSLLQLAEELGNVSKACKIMGYHRDTFYEVRRAFQVGGVGALIEQRRGPRNPHPNRVAPEVEEAILALCLEFPTYGAQRIANELRLRDVNVSPSGVRGVWLRHDLETRHKRLLRLEARAQEDTFVLSDAQVRLLERHSCEFRMRHVETNGPGELLNQDTYYWGTLKGVGKVYVQVVVDAFCSLAFAKVYTSKMPITSADLLYDRVLPFYETLGVAVKAILTDNGREFCGRPEQHPYELLLALHDIEHRTTRIRSPRTNGFVERMNRTLLDECFRVAGRQTWYLSPEEIQRDLDRFLEFYNLRRSHQGYRLKGRTPAQALREALGTKKLPPIVPKDDANVEKKAA
ncbi:IS481 family transposase [Thioalkalivibrio thiocyanodenitrificans]|uniref:IS481 family transposase n=1 Tax=Thioalkalivibrio thiocyanodenitrificans TaxID=243063 RepID=UPI000360C63E|nr:IS481 family transposase [Thioalkalivibrio thiocyanodenitrificans]